MFSVGTILVGVIAGAAPAVRLAVPSWSAWAARRARDAARANSWLVRAV